MRIGEVTHVDHLPRKTCSSSKTGRRREVMVPFVAAIVPEVDVAAGTLTVTPPAGLFEELVDDDCRRSRGEAEADESEGADADGESGASDTADDRDE